MKKIILINLLLALSILSYSQQKLFKEQGKTQTLTLKEYNTLKEIKVKKLQKISAEIKLVEIIIDSITNNENIIYTYKLDRVFNNGARISSNAQQDEIYSLYGKTFPDFNLTSYDGKEVKLSDYKGKPVFIDLWFIGCKTCVKEMPTLNKIKERYKDKVTFLSITYNTESELKTFFTTHKFNFIHLINAKEFLNNLGITSYPKNILIDKNGKTHQIMGGIIPKLDSEDNIVSGDGEEIIREIEKVL
ncbi:MAG: TlpA family protein disulfide reductase [Bacteroidales bacterium]|nr:TlpA family protein disulfide reductase [Bacteroidales bacterium]